ncbi:hypothetical protein, partial [uncultured Rikenella sp.]|uniref:hypothetical protein n=1 Tax=uncultured Rikenella sp. TaxID=368003 RepID=UPI0025D678CD
RPDVVPVFSCVASRNKRTPAPGYRDAGTDGSPGECIYISHSGYNWSVGILDSDAQFLWFSPHGIGPSGICNRSCGIQLRCLSE